MVWSLLKVVIFVALAALVAWGAGFVIETPGKVQIAFGGREVLLEPVDFLVVVLFGFLAFWLLLKAAGFLVALLRFLNGDETAISRYFDRNRERRGFDALAEGMIALASGDGREAQVKAAKAERLLDRPDLTKLLIAQAAEMSGNTARAEEQWKLLAQDDRTKLVGALGLMRQKLAEGRNDVALRLAEKAFALRPDHPGVLESLLKLQCEAADWSGARKTIDAQVRARLLPRDVGARREAVLALSAAREAEAAGDLPKARLLAYEANRLAPALVPAAVTSARLKAQEGDRRTAERIVKKAWEAQPHPDLAAAFAAIEPEESGAARGKRFKTLLALRAEAPETKLTAAELALTAEDFPAARRALGDLAETRPTARTLMVRAAVERGEGSGDDVVRGWLARAVTAPRDEHWTCEKCKHVHSGWAPVCENCGAFDTLAWTMPPALSGSDPGSAMLPLLVGTPDAPAAMAAPADPGKAA